MKTSIVTIILLALLIVAPLSAETIAVSVRQTSDHELAPLLAASVEQGAMDYLFGAGHIVFDLEIDPTDEAYRYRAIDLALDGGAAYALVLELAFTTQGDELAPGGVELTVIDAQTEEDLSSASFRASDLDRHTELAAQSIADRLGGLSAAAALAAISGGGPDDR